jgi:hypothetical protein
MPAHSCRCRLESCPLFSSAAETASFSLSHEREESGAAHGYPPPPPPPLPPPPLISLTHTVTVARSIDRSIDRSTDRSRSIRFRARARLESPLRWTSGEDLSADEGRGSLRGSGERRVKGNYRYTARRLVDSGTDPPCVNIPAPRHELYRS